MRGLWAWVFALLLPFAALATHEKDHVWIIRRPGSLTPDE